MAEPIRRQEMTHDPNSLRYTNNHDFYSILSLANHNNRQRKKGQKTSCNKGKQQDDRFY